jgi:serine/threonine-protein kinase HipA
MGLPGPVYDALPDGWGMLLMDRYFRKIGLHPARIGPLERLTYISTHATGALSFEPCVADMQTSENIPLPQSKKSSKEKVANFYNICWSWVAPPRCQIQSIGLPRSCQF